MNQYLIFPLFIFYISFGQELDENLTIGKKSLMILPASQKKYGPVADKVTSIIADAATSVGRFEVIDRSLVDEILEEQAFQLSGIVSDEQVVEFGEMAAAEEALIINIVHFGQKGVPKAKKEDDEDEDDKDETLFSWVIKKTVTAAVDNTNSEKEKRQLELENNIHTVINANVRLVNVRTGVSEKSFKLGASHTGGNRDASLEKTLSNLTFQVRSKLKELYMITSEVMEVDGKTISILSGENLGLEKGDFFEIASKDKQKTYKGRAITLPGKTRGLARITEVGPDASKAKVVRKWRKVKEGHKAYEMLTNPYIVDLSLSYGPLPHYDLTGKLLINPFGLLSGSLNGHFGFIQDSRDKMDSYLGIGGSFDFTLFSGFGSTVSTSLDLPICFAFTQDDSSHSVRSGLVMPAARLNLGVQIGKHWDLVLSMKNILLTNRQAWTYSVKTGEKDDNGNDKTRQERAFWDVDDGAPTIDAEGSIFSVSLRRYWF
jgi:hypothetical protein